MLDREWSTSGCCLELSFFNFFFMEDKASLTLPRTQAWCVDVAESQNIETEKGGGPYSECVLVESWSNAKMATHDPDTERHLARLLTTGERSSACQFVHN